jgi:signal transduction histidine kinase/CheY-like chemotaxis protein
MTDLDQHRAAIAETFNAYLEETAAQAQAAFLAQTIYNQGRMRSVRNARSVSKKLCNHFNRFVANANGAEEAVALGKELGEAGMVVKSGAALLAALSESGWITALDDQQKQSAAMRLLNQFQQEFISGLAQTREAYILQSHETSQTALQHSLREQLQEQEQLRQNQERLMEQSRQILELNARLSQLTDQEQLLAAAVTDVSGALALTGSVICEQAEMQKEWRIRAAYGPDLSPGDAAPALFAKLLNDAVAARNAIVHPFADSRGEPAIYLATAFGIGAEKQGGIIVQSDQPRYADEILVFTRTFAQNLSALWRNLELLTEARRHAHELEILHGRYVDTLWASEESVLTANYKKGSVNIQRGRAAASPSSEGDGIVLPLVMGDHPFGVISLPEKRALPDDAREQTLALLREMGNALNNAYLLQTTRAYSAQLQVAAEVSRAISATLDRDLLIREVVKLIRDQFDLYYVGLFLSNDRNEAVLQAGTGEAGKALVAQNYRLSLNNHSMIGQAITHHTAQVEQDVRRAAIFLPNPLLPHTRAEAAVPLRSRGQTIGALTVQSREVGAFGAEIMAVLQSLADQIATAIENAILFTTVQTSLTQSEQLYETGQRISAAADSAAVYQALIDFASQLGPFNVVHIATVDPQKPGHVHVPLIWSEKPVRMNASASHIPFNDFPAGKMMLQNERVVLADVRHNPLVDRPSQIIMRRNRLNSCTMLPIQTEGEWIATLVLYQESAQPANEHDLQPLLTLCAQAGITLSNQKLLAETNALYRIGRLLNQATNQEDALKTTVQELASHLLTRQCRIILYNELMAEGYIAAAYQPIEAMTAVRLPMLGDYVFETLEVEQRPLFLQDIPDQPADIEQSAAVLLRPFGFKSSLLAPAVSQGKLIGFISLDSYQGRSFSASETNFAQAIADQFTTAVEGIKLFDEAVRRAQELVSLNQIGSRISGILELTELAQTIYQQTGQILDNNVFLLSNYDAKSRFYQPILYINNGQEIEKPGRVLSPDEPLYRFLHGAMPLVADPNTPIMENEGSFNQQPVDKWPESAIWIPLQQEDKPAGLLCLMSPRPHAYSDNDIQLLRSIATQTGLALSNAALFQQTQQNVAELRTLFSITQAAAASIDAQERVENVVKAIHANLKQASVSILLINQADDLLETVANQGEPAMPPTLPLDEGLIGQVVALGQPLLVGDLRELPEFMDEKRPSLSQLVAPLNLGRRTIGVINVESDQEDAFTEADLRMLQTVSVSLASTIESGRLFQEIQQANEQLRELDRVKTQFLANMSHELRTPLNSIIGFSRVILKGIDGPITPEQEEDLTSIHNSGQHLLRLINDILDLAKIEAGKIALAFEELDLEEVAQNALSTIRGLISEKPVKLIWEIEPNLPLIEADSIRMRQILLNLLSNAAKFTDKGHIKLEIRRAGRRHVDIVVQDTGPGVRREDYDRLFRAFEQADASPTRAVGGTGLGLPITKRLIELHRGEIWFESHVGRGTTFTVRLPIRQGAGERPTSGDIVGFSEENPNGNEQDRISRTMSQLTAGDHPNFNQNQPAILIVEDDPGVMALYERYLREQPYQLLMANSGAAALSEIARYREQINLVLLDINMPDLDGWDVLKVIRDNPATSQIPVLICSIDNEPEKAARLGAQRLLPKPIMETELLEAIAERLE